MITVLEETRYHPLFSRGIEQQSAPNRMQHIRALGQLHSASLQGRSHASAMPDTAYRRSLIWTGVSIWQTSWGVCLGSH